MDLQDKYDELDNFIDGLSGLIDDSPNRYYADQLELIKFEAQNEFDEVSEQLEEQQKQENKELEREYWRAVI